MTSERVAPTVPELLDLLVRDDRVGHATVTATETWRREDTKGIIHTADAELIVHVTTARHGTLEGIPGGECRLARLKLDGERIVEVRVEHAAPWALVSIVTRAWN